MQRPMINLVRLEINDDALVLRYEPIYSGRAFLGLVRIPDYGKEFTPSSAEAELP